MTEQQAYDAGYEHGWAGTSLKTRPPDWPSDPTNLMWYKAGWVDGKWDRDEDLPYKTTQEGPDTDQIGE